MSAVGVAFDQVLGNDKQKPVHYHGEIDDDLLPSDKLFRVIELMAGADKPEKRIQTTKSHAFFGMFLLY